MSHLARIVQQPDLPALALPEATEARLRVRESEMGEYSGRRFFEQRPELYRACVELLAREMGIRETAAVLDIAPRTVMAVRDREGVAISTRKERLSRTFSDVAQLAAESARERLAGGEKPALRDLLLVGAIATDKSLVLSGDVTARVEHIVRDDGDDYERILDQARARGRVIEGELVADTDLTPKDSSAKGTPPPALPAPAQGDRSGPAEPAYDASRDMQSTASISNLHGINDSAGRDTPSVDADSACEAAADPGAGAGAGQGGRGSARGAGASTSNISDPTEFHGKGTEDGDQ